MNADGRQLRLLVEIADVLGGACIPFWLRGGWALDFLVGELRTGHGDLDLVAWRRDRDAISDLLTRRGFEFDRELPQAAVDFRKDGESVQVLLLERSSSGELVCHGFEQWPFPAGALDGPVRGLGGVCCRTLAPHALLEEKTTYQTRRGRPPRPKDHDSIRLLRQIPETPENPHGRK